MIDIQPLVDKVEELTSLKTAMIYFLIERDLLKEFQEWQNEKLIALAIKNDKTE